MKLTLLLPSLSILILSLVFLGVAYKFAFIILNEEEENLLFLFDSLSIFIPNFSAVCFANGVVKIEFEKGALLDNKLDSSVNGVFLFI